MPAPFDFVNRPPSTAWEPMQISTGQTFWIWVKPAHFPQGVLVMLPEDMPRGTPESPTMRVLLNSAQIPAEAIFSWAVNGMAFDSQQGQNPLLDQPLPLALQGADPGIMVAMAPVPAAPPAPMPPAMPMQQPVAMPLQANALNRPATAEELELLDSIKTEWNNSIAMEAELSRNRKLLTDMVGKLKSLNRDLNTDERTYSSSQDKRDWQDARRWLRDCSQSLARCLKEFDIGFTSKAGQRSSFEETYEKFVEPRIPFDGLSKAHSDYQIYHKSLQTLLSSMKSGLQHASQNGERRAQRVLASIAAKVRDGNTRKSFIDVIK
ncbi:MAG: hypothetical protein ACE37I_14925 [Rubinisphaera brasiliensis]|nr:hypothetical protein [Rubinisphaera brasiliensis]MBR9802936.1 hypothetical protein [bacterium]